MTTYVSADSIEIELPYLGNPGFRSAAVMFGGGIVVAGGDCTETNVTTPTLTFPAAPIPQYPFQENVSFRTDKTPHADGTEKRLRRWTEDKLSYRLTWKVLTDTDMAILWAFFLSTKGSFYKFDFYDPRDGITLLGQFRFLDDMMSRERFENNLESTGLIIVEVLEDPV